MPTDGLLFDLYDERWRDCWVAATATTRLKRRQIDLDIRQRVGRLLEDYGPESERPLTLRIYGTMIKGFCVINNERVRVLFTDCERVVLAFAKEPFAEVDRKLKMPASKRPRMEAALTLDLARVEAAEAYDWLQAPLETGALLQLGGLEGAQELPPSFGLLDQGPLQPLLPDALGVEAAVPGSLLGLAPPTAGDGGWLPSGVEQPLPMLTIPEQLPVAEQQPLALMPPGTVIDVEAQTLALLPPGMAPEQQQQPEQQEVQQQHEGIPAGARFAGLPGSEVPSNQNLLAIEAGAPQEVPLPEAPTAVESVTATSPPGDGLPATMEASTAVGPAPQPLAVPSPRPKRPKRELFGRPGLVYGFDDDPMIPSREYDRWQQEECSAFTRPRMRAPGYADAMDMSWDQGEHLGPRLQLLANPPCGVLPRSDRGERAAAQPTESQVYRALFGGDGPTTAAEAVAAAAAAAAAEAAAASEAQVVAAEAQAAAEAAAAEAAAAAMGEDPAARAVAEAAAAAAAEVAVVTAAEAEAAAATAVAAAEAAAEAAANPQVAELALALPPAAGGQGVGELALSSVLVPLEGQGATLGGGGAPEAQDDRTAEVGEIIKGCLRSSGLGTASFHELVPPGAADRATAACTFSALLALASAGELRAVQTEPYGKISISEC